METFRTGAGTGVLVAIFMSPTVQLPQPGQKDNLLYSRELDLQIADHVRLLLAEGKRVTVQDMCTYARKLVHSIIHGSNNVVMDYKVTIDVD